MIKMTQQTITKRKIYLDTNFILLPFQFRVDIFEDIRNACDFPYELMVPEGVLEELHTLSVNRKLSAKDRSYAKMALEWIKRLEKAKDLKIVSLTHIKYVDDLLVSLSKEDNVIIATVDKELKKRIRERARFSILTLRQKKYIKLEGVKNVL